MTEPQEQFQLGQQIGEMNAKLSSLIDAFSKNQRTQDDRYNQTVRNHTENIGRFFKVEKSVASLEDEFRAIRKPVNDMIALRKSAMAWVGVLSAIGGALYFFWSGIAGALSKVFVDGILAGHK